MAATDDRGTGERSGWLTPQRLVALLLAAGAAVFVLQNRDDVTLRFLGVSVTAAMWLASVGLVVLGVAIGVLWNSRRRGR